MDHDAPPPASEPASRRTFTVKSVMTGLLFAVGICFVAGFSEQVLNTRVIGSYMPPAACMPLLALIVAWNPVWVRIGRGTSRWRRRAGSLAFSSRELAVVLAFSLVACFAPTSNLFRYFHQALVVPVLSRDTRPNYRPVLDSVDARLFPLRGDLEHPDAEAVYRGFQSGMSTDDGLSGTVGFFDWPWRAWLEPMLHWTPLLLATLIVSLGLALVVHRQWSRHEVLSYPLAQIYDGLIARAPTRAWPDLFRDRLFWFAAIPVMGWHGLRAASAYFPDVVPFAPSEWHFNLPEVFPALEQSGYAPGYGMLFFVFVGVAYFLASDVGFTLGVSNFILGIAAVYFLRYTGRPLAYNQVESMRAGGYIAYGVTLFWVGRHWYGGVFARAFGRRGSTLDDPDRIDAAWGARAVLLGGIGLVIALRGVGMPWVAALALAVFWPLFVVVMSRLVCETGMPLITFRLFTSHVTTLLGPAAVGPKGLATLGFVGQTIAQDPRETLLPYTSTALYVGEKRGVRPGRLGAWLFAAALVALTVGFAARSWMYYSWGGMADAWASHHAMGQTLSKLDGLGRQGLLAASAEAGEGGRFALIRPDGDWIGWLAAGGAITLVLATLRLRVGRWPIHPLLLLLWGSHAANVSYQAILIGWFVKTLVVTYGGGRVYQRGKSFSIGLVAGELVAGGVVIALGFLYYWGTGAQPPAFSVYFQ